MVSFVVTPVTQSVDEGGDLVFTIKILNPNYAAAGSYKIYWRTNSTADNAASSSDYAAVSSPQALTFSASTSQSFTIRISTKSDNIVENREYFAVDLYDFAKNYLSGSEVVFSIKDVPPAKPDLSISALTLGASSVPAGGGVSVNFTITNSGAASAAASTAKLYLSHDGVIDSSDTLLGTFSMSALAAGQSFTSGLSALIPAGWSTGTSYVGVLADTGGAVGETSEANNSLAKAFTVTVPAKPDLSIGALTLGASSVPAGGGLSVDFTITNNGAASAAASTAKLYLSHDGVIDSSDTLLGTFSMPTLAAGQSFTSGLSALIPAGWSTGTSHVGVLADTGEVVGETSEANNSFAKAFNVTPGLPVVSIAAASADKFEGNGGVTAFTFTLARTGDVSVGSSVSWAIAADQSPAANSNDFTGATSGSVTWVANETSVKTITLNVIGDTAYESAGLPEHFTVTLSNASGATIGAATANGHIQNDDVPTPSRNISVPYPFSGSFVVTQGVSGTTSHTEDIDNGVDPDFWTSAYDFGLPSGTKVLSVAPGRVVSVDESVLDGENGPSHGLGNYITILHNEGLINQFYATYAHLKHVEVYYVVGNIVSVGSVLAESGETGNTKRQEHLHFQFSSELYSHWSGAKFSLSSDEYDSLVNFNGVSPSEGSLAVGNLLVISVNYSNKDLIISPSGGQNTLVLDGGALPNNGISIGAQGQNVVVRDGITNDVLLQASQFTELAFNGGSGVDVFAVHPLSGTDIANSTVYFNGMAGDDRLEAGDADKRIVAQAGSGDDFLRGGTQNDALSGEGGADTLVGGSGDDSLDGGGDIDTASYAVAAVRVDVNLALAGAAQDTGDGRDILISIENLTGSAFDDVLTGDGAANVLTGGDGQDWLVSAGGFDTLSGGLGHDSVWGGVGDDVLDGGPGDDTLDGGAGVDTVTYATATSAVEIDLSIVEDQLTRGAGVDTLVSIENVVGSSFADRLTGGAGSNVLTGGAGADIFVFVATGWTSTAAPDTITDFTPGSDRIDLSMIDADRGLAGDQAFHLGATAGRAGDIVVTYDVAQSRTVVGLYVDADATVDAMIWLAGNPALTGADFVL